MKSTGTKYEATHNLTTTEIAKLVRADIKAAVKAGTLPGGKYSVRTRYASMMSAIDVTIKSFECNVLNPARIYAQADSPHDFDAVSEYEIYAPEYKAAVAFIEEILDTYNRKDIDSQSDLHNVRFFSSVTASYILRSAEEKLTLENRPEPTDDEPTDPDGSDSPATDTISADERIIRIGDTVRILDAFPGAGSEYIVTSIEPGLYDVPLYYGEKGHSPNTSEKLKKIASGATEATPADSPVIATITPDPERPVELQLSRLGEEAIAERSQTPVEAVEEMLDYEIDRFMRLSRIADDRAELNEIMHRAVTGEVRVLADQYSERKRATAKAYRRIVVALQKQREENARAIPSPPDADGLVNVGPVKGI